MNCGWFMMKFMRNGRGLVIFGIVRTLIFILVVCFGLNQVFGQAYIQKSVRLEQNYKEIRDSIRKKYAGEPRIIISTCKGFSEYNLINTDLGWTGIYLVNLLDCISCPDSHSIDSNGRRVRSSFKSKIYYFRADSLVRELRIKNIDSIKQLSEKEVANAYNLKKYGPNSISFGGLPISSHDCKMTIILDQKNEKSVQYRGVLVHSDELHFIKTLAIFKVINSYLHDYSWKYFMK